MPKFKFFIDQVIIVNDRYSFEVKADSLEQAKVTAIAIHNYEKSLPDDYDVEGIGDIEDAKPNQFATPYPTRILYLSDPDSDTIGNEISTNYHKSIPHDTSDIAYENSSVIIYCVNNYYKIVWKNGGNDVYQPTLPDAKKYLGITDYSNP